MLTVALILIIAGILTHIGVGIYSVIQVTRRYDQVAEGLRAFVTPESPEDPSDLHKTLDQVAAIFADRYRVAMTAADRGATGAAARDVNRGLEEIAVAGDPALAVAQALPKSLRKNPLALAGLNMVVQNILSKQGIGSGGSPGFNGGSGNQIKFDL